MAVATRTTKPRPAATSRRLHRPPPAGPRGTGGGAQAPRHVHRLDRLARPHALPLGDHRQRRRRGAGRECDRIDVVLLADGSVEVRDNGRGIPVDVEPRTGLSGVEVVFTKLHAGGKFGGGSYTASGGLHGVGASVVNALSARLEVEVDRGGKTHAMSFRRGEPGVFADGVGHQGRRARRTRRSPPTSRTASCASSARPRGGAPAAGSATGPTSRSSCAPRPSPTTTWSPGRGRRPT